MNYVYFPILVALGITFSSSLFNASNFVTRSQYNKIFSYFNHVLGLVSLKKVGQSKSHP